MTKVTNSSGDTIAYTYDVLGQRIAKKVNGMVTRFVWRSGHVLYETTGSGTITLSYTWGLSTDDLVAIHDHGSDAHYYVVQDKLRSVRGLVNRNTTWYASWRYKAYGEQLATSGSSPITMRFRWAGAQYDAETGFYFLRSRYYDPDMMRFTQEDKIGFAGGGNLYAYTADPVEARDPGGTAQDYDEQYHYLNPDQLTGRKYGEAGSWGFGDAYAGDLVFAALMAGVETAVYEYLMAKAEELAMTGSVMVVQGDNVLGVTSNGADLSGTHAAVLANVFAAGLGTQGLYHLNLSSGERSSPGDGYRGLDLTIGGRIPMHSYGLAVDINRVNGMYVRRSHATPDVIWNLQANLMGTQHAAEVYGPFGAVNRQWGGNGNWRWAGNSTLATHDDHIHYSTYLTSWVK